MTKGWWMDVLVLVMPLDSDGAVKFRFM